VAVFLIAGSALLVGSCGPAGALIGIEDAETVNPNLPNMIPATGKAWEDGNASQIAAQVAQNSFLMITRAGLPAGSIPGQGAEVAPRAPSTPCPPILFAQVPLQETLAFDSTGATAYTIPLFRQPDGSFTAQSFSLPASATNPVGTPVTTLTQAQAYFSNCTGISPWTPVPHHTILADMPGSMSRDAIVTNLGGPSTYAGLKVGSSITVTLDSQTTLGSSYAAYPVGSARGMLTADFNGDGKRDVAVVGDGSPGSVSILLGNGNGTLGAAKTIAVGNGSVAMTSLDFDKDGRADLAVVNQSDNTVTILLANADGSMRTGATYNLPGNFPTQNAIVAADFDGDGNADVMVYSVNGFSLLHGNGDGTFQVLPQKTGYTPTYVPLYLAPGDFNKDGKMDLASFNSDGTVALLLNAGDGSFPTSTRYMVGTPFSAGIYQLGMFATDFNDDGNLDLVFGTGHPDALYPNPLFVTVLLGKGDGTFRGAAPAYDVGNGPGGMAVADFNGDGRSDLVVASETDTFSPSLWILLGAQGGGFQTPTTLAMPAGAGFAAGVAAVDLNGDGRADIIAFDSPFGSAGHVYTWLGKGDVTFQASASYPAGNRPTSFTVGDVNGDGLPDLLITYGNLNETTPGVTTALLMTGKAGGGFNTGATVPTGVNTVQVALADVNGDGKPDIIAVNMGICNTGYAGAVPSAGNVSVSINNGNGTFKAPVPYTVGLNPTWVTVADVNGDGKPDLIVGAITATTANIGILIGNGNGTFGVPTLLSTYSWPSSIMVADFDGDGNLDLAITHVAADPPVTVMQGNGNGTFQPESMVLAGSSPIAAVAADFTGNGRPDLAVLNTDVVGEGGTVNLFHNISTSTPCTFSLNGSSQSYTAAGGTGSFQLTAGKGCNWAAVSGNLSFLQVTSGEFGSNSETVAFSVGANTGAARSATVTVGGQTFTVNQAGTGGASAATHFTVAAPASATASASFNFTVNALDANNNTVTGYTGTVHFSSTDGAAALPSNTTLTSGTGTFAATLKTSGSQTITATDTATASITGSSAAIIVTTTAVTPPMPLSVSPAGGSAPSATYSFTYTDPRGYQDLNVVNILVNNFLDGRHACYLAYVVSSSTLILVDDGGDAGGPYAGSVVLGNSAAIQNSQCSVTLVSAVGGGNTLTLTLTISWAAGFAGDKIIQMAARDAAQNDSGWQALGVGRVPGPAQTPIAVVGMSPDQGSGAGPTPFTFNFTDARGYADMGVENILINTALNGQQACYLAFSRPGNVLYLVNDAGAALLPAQSMAAAGSLSNSQCAVTWGASAVNAGGNNLSLTLNIAFMGALSGNDVIYLASRDVNEANSTDWHAMGTWTGAGGSSGDTTTGLAGWWKFDEGTGTVAGDSSSNGNTGNLTGNATWTAGKFGDAVNLDGVTGYVQGSGTGSGFPRGSAARSISAWVNVPNPPAADNAILHYGTASGSPAASNFHLYLTGSPAGRVGLGNGYGFGTIEGTKSVSDGAWHLVVGIYDPSAGASGTAYIYIDGVLDTSGPLGTVPNTGSVSNWRIGQFIAPSTAFRGALDDVRIYSRALALADIQALYAGH